MTGRRPKPTALKLLAGNPGRRKLNPDEPMPDDTMPPCPEHLSTEAKVEWGRMADRLYRLGLLTEIDGTALALYCDAYGRWVAAKEKVEASGPVIKTVSGNVIQNPYMAVANKAHEQMVKMLVEFGMTPASRSRVSAQKKPQEGNEFAKLG